VTLWGAKGKHYIRHNPKFKEVTMYYNEEENKVCGIIDFGDLCEGPPGCVHGGAIAALFDMSFAAAVSHCSLGGTGRSVTVNLNVNFRKFVPLDSVKRMEAKVERHEGRKIFLTASLTDGDTHEVHADATALFLEYDHKKIRVNSVTLPVKGDMSEEKKESDWGN